MTKTQSRTLIVGLFVAICSIVLLWVSSLAGVPNTLKFLLGSVASLFLVSVAIYLIFDFFLRRAWINELFAEAHTAEQVVEAGLQGFQTDFYHVDFDGHFAASQHLDIWVTYARTWSRQNQHNLESLLAKPGGRIRLLVPDPNNAVLMSELARRFDQDSPDVVRGYIHELTTSVASLRGASASNVEIRFAAYSPWFTFYLFDTSVVLALGKHGNSPGTVLAFEGKLPGSLYEYVAKQFACMWGEAKPPETPTEDLLTTNERLAHQSSLDSDAIS